MMGFLLLNAQPRRIAMIGLGGGSLAKFCYRILPRTRIDVFEINPHVVALRDEFRGEVFCVDEKDGTNRVAFACTGDQLRQHPRLALRAPDPIPQASWDSLLPEFARVRWAIRRSFA